MVERDDQVPPFVSHNVPENESEIKSTVKSNEWMLVHLPGSGVIRRDEGMFGFIVERFSGSSSIGNRQRIRHHRPGNSVGDAINSHLFQRK